MRLSCEKTAGFVFSGFSWSSLQNALAEPECLCFRVVVRGRLRQIRLPRPFRHASSEQSVNYIEVCREPYSTQVKAFFIIINWCGVCGGGGTFCGPTTLTLSICFPFGLVWSRKVMPPGVVFYESGGISGAYGGISCGGVTLCRIRYTWHTGHNHLSSLVRSKTTTHTRFRRSSFFIYRHD